MPKVLPGILQRMRELKAQRNEAVEMREYWYRVANGLELREDPQAPSSLTSQEQS